MRLHQSNAGRLKPAHEEVEYPFYTSGEEVLTGLIRCLEATGSTENIDGLYQELRLETHRNNQDKHNPM